MVFEIGVKGSEVGRLLPEQLLVGEQLLEMFGEELLLQRQVDPGPDQSHLRQTFTHPLDKPGGAGGRQQHHGRCRASIWP